MSGSAGSGAARKFLKELFAGNFFISQEIFSFRRKFFLLIAYFSLDTWKIIAKVMQITLYIAE